MPCSWSYAWGTTFGLLTTCRCSDSRRPRKHLTWRLMSVGSSGWHITLSNFKLRRSLLYADSWEWCPYVVCKGHSQNGDKRLLASSCLSLRPHGTTRLPLGRFSLSLIFEYFSKKSVRYIQVSLKYDKNNGHFTWRDMYIYTNISLNSS
jgi:hypothetical protein